MSDPNESEPRRDPWTIGGLATLAILTLMVILLYRAAPQSLVQASTQTWLAARPNDTGPLLAHARERLEYAAAQVAAGNDSLALEADSIAAESAWRARGLSEEAVGRATATSLWSEAMLTRAAMLHRLGTGSGLQADDNVTLRRALSHVDRVIAMDSAASTQARADSLRNEIDRELRIGPLEWLPDQR